MSMAGIAYNVMDFARVLGPDNSVKTPHWTSFEGNDLALLMLRGNLRRA